MWFYSNTSVPTTLLNDIDATATSIQIGDTAGLPVQYPYTLVLDFEGTAMEVVNVTSAAGSSLIIQRGQDGTSAQPHTAGAVVVHAAVARDLQEPQDHIASDQNVHGIGASSFVVGTESTQTLTNKTIDGDLNTLVNIHASSIDPFNALEIDQTQDTDPGLEIFGHDGVSTLPNIHVHIGDIQDGIILQQIDGPTEPGYALTVQTPSGVDRFSVTKDGNIQSVANAAFQGDLDVDGNTSLRHTQIAQWDPALVGLTVSAPNGSTNDLVRIVSDTGATGLHVRRNNSTVTGSNLQAWVTETGTTMASVSRLGVLTLNQQTTNTQVMTVNAHASAGTSAVRFIAGGGTAAALDVRRSTSSTTGDLQTWTTEGSGTLASVSRDGTIRGSNVETTQNMLVGSDGSGSLTVNGTVTAAGQINANGGVVSTFVNTTGDVNVGTDGSGNLDVDGTLAVSGTAALGATTVNGNMNVTGTLSAQNIVTGTVNITPTPNTPTAASVSFGTTLPAPVRAFVTILSAVPGSTVITASIDNVTQTGMQIYIYRTNATQTTVHWMAIGGGV